MFRRVERMKYTPSRERVPSLTSAPATEAQTHERIGGRAIWLLEKRHRANALVVRASRQTAYLSG